MMAQNLFAKEAQQARNQAGQRECIRLLAEGQFDLHDLIVVVDYWRFKYESVLRTKYFGSLSN